MIKINDESKLKLMLGGDDTGDDKTDDETDDKTDDDTGDDDAGDDDAGDDKTNDDTNKPDEKINTITATEIFDLNVAKKLLAYKNYFRNKIQEECDKDIDPFHLLAKYVNNSNKGKVNVSYQQKKNRGRYFVNHSCGLQSMSKKIRGTIAGNLYYDIDMVNCHPVIFKHLCRNAGLSTVYISYYCSNRDKIIEELIKLYPKYNKDDIKGGLLSILNGGYRFYEKIKETYKKNNEIYNWLMSFYDEVNKNIKALCDLNIDIYNEKIKEKTFNPIGSTVNILFCIEEIKLLNIMIDYFKKVGVISHKNEYVNCFDGIMIEKKKCKNLEKLTLHIEEIEKLFKKSGFKMKLKIKEFEKIDMFIDSDVKADDAMDNDAVDTITKKIKMPNCFDYDDDYTYGDFRNEFKKTCFESKQELFEVIGKNFPRVIAKTSNKFGAYIKKNISSDGDPGVDMVGNLGITNFDMSYSIGGGKYEKISFSSVMEYFDNFNGVICNLDKSKMYLKEFNIWQGFKAREIDLDTIDDDIKAGLEEVKKFIFETWASSNEEYYNYIISWMAGLVDVNMNLNRASLVLISKPGSGKGTITDFISQYILGEHACADIAGIAKITQKHNSVIMGKRMIVVNEMSSTRDEFVSNFETMKHLITDKKISVEPKGYEPIQIDNITNYIFCSNNPDSMIVSDGDRRYAVFKVCEKYVGNFEYYKEFRNRCFNKNVGNAFYTYLLHFKRVDVQKIPDTESRRLMQELSLSTTQKFYNDIVEEKTYENGDEIKASVLYDRFRIWCNNNGERCISNTKFGVKIIEILDKIKKRDAAYYVWKC